MQDAEIIFLKKNKQYNVKEIIKYNYHNYQNKKFIYLETGVTRR